MNSTHYFKLERIDKTTDSKLRFTERYKTCNLFPTVFNTLVDNFKSNENAITILEFDFIFDSNYFGIEYYYKDNNNTNIQYKVTCYIETCASSKARIIEFINKF